MPELLGIYRFDFRRIDSPMWAMACGRYAVFIGHATFIGEAFAYRVRLPGRPVWGAQECSGLLLLGPYKTRTAAAIALQEAHHA